MLALEKLQNTSCRTGPKMDQTIAGGSRSRKDQTLNELSSREGRRALARNGGFATERAWTDARLAYRRIVFRMIRSIEMHCDDVISLSKNYLQLSSAQFESLCNQESVDAIVELTSAELKLKQANLRRTIRKEAAGSDSEDNEEITDDDEDNCVQTTQASEFTQYASSVAL